MPAATPAAADPWRSLVPVSDFDLSRAAREPSLDEVGAAVRGFSGG
jgi:hypothetical protein